jgi:hypothetical protein
MAEHPVTNVMHEGRGDSYFRLVLPILSAVSAHIAPDYLHKLARDVKHPEAMGEAGMSRAREHEFGEPKLSNPA